MPLSRDQILAAADRRTRTVHVPEWGGDVIIASMSGAARDAWELWIGDARQRGQFNNVRARLLSACIVDESGQRIFTSEADIEALGSKDSMVLDRLFEVARELNGLTDDAIEAAKKNSSHGLSADSGSA